MRETFVRVLTLCFLLIGAKGFCQVPSITEPLEKEFMKSGSDGAVKLYGTLKKAEPKKYDYSEPNLRDFALQLIQIGRMEDARKFFKLNSEAFPKSSEAFYYLGFSEYQLHDNANALNHLKKACELNAKNFAAADLIVGIEHPEVYAKYNYVCGPCYCSQHDLRFKDPGTCVQCGMKFIKKGIL